MALECVAALFDGAPQGAGQNLVIGDELVQPAVHADDEPSEFLSVLTSATV